jgi:hypothetical protein
MNKVVFLILTVVSGPSKSVLEVVLNRLAVIEMQQKMHTVILNDILNAVQRDAVVAPAELLEELPLPVDSVDNLMELEGKKATREARKDLVSAQIFICKKDTNKEWKQLCKLVKVVYILCLFRQIESVSTNRIHEWTVTVAQVGVA